MTTYVFSKTPEEQAVVQIDVTSLMKPAETISNVQLNAVSPAGLTAAVQSVQGFVIGLMLTGGTDGVAYGVPVQITTNARVFIVTAAISVVEAKFVPYTTQNPDAVVDLVDTIEAGKSAIGTAVFSFDNLYDPAGGFVTWELLAEDGTVFAAGNAFELKIDSNGIRNNVTARCIINVPSDLPPSLEDEKYLIRYTLQLPQPQGIQPDTPESMQYTFYAYEYVSVVGLNTVPLGVQDLVEIKGNPAHMSLVVDRLYDHVSVAVYSGNTLIAGPLEITDRERVSSGWYYAAVVPTGAMTESLEPYTVVWSYFNEAAASQVFQESARLFVITPTIATAIADVKSKINKARATLYGTPDLLFPEEVVMVWLRRGADYFNGAFGKFTRFTMTNARGPIREYWLMCCEVLALQSQELAEAEKAFDFQGAAISLSVDRTQAYGALADKIQGRLDNELKDFKVNLIIKGNTSGDGSADPGRLGKGAIGAVGLTITPATAWGYPARTGWMLGR